MLSVDPTPDARFYAIAFWLSMPRPALSSTRPWFGLGEETAWQEACGGEGRDAGFGSCRWNAAEWNRI
jgi:hypothetical protein